MLLVIIIMDSLQRINDGSRIAAFKPRVWGAAHGPWTPPNTEISALGWSLWRSCWTLGRADGARPRERIRQPRGIGASPQPGRTPGRPRCLRSASQRPGVHGDRRSAKLLGGARRMKNQCKKYLIHLLNLNV